MRERGLPLDLFEEQLVNEGRFADLHLFLSILTEEQLALPQMMAS